MKKTFIILIGFMLFESLAFGQQNSRNDIEAFNSFLGQKKANAFNAAVMSLDQFLLNNYGNHKSYASRTKAFLEQIYNFNEPHSSWTLETEKNLIIIKAFESSGLRKEIWIHGYEKYEPKYNLQEFLKPEAQDSMPIADLGKLDIDLIEEEIVPNTKIDSAEIARKDKQLKERIENSLRINPEGEFLYGLAKYNLGDSIIQEYVDYKSKGINMSPAIIASGFLEQKMNFDDPFIKRIMVVEFYYWIMEWDIHRKEIK